MKSYSGEVIFEMAFYDVKAKSEEEAKEKIRQLWLEEDAPVAISEIIVEELA